MCLYAGFPGETRSGFGPNPGCIVLLTLMPEKVKRDRG